ncbi:CoA transferase [Nocardia sp. ET3-3]|uniref:CoA transferase n=1 Tax=Nocardia terrae TaxID=2675851 RepID=A0A7K1UV93_9NOCA|nr:CoA transferase [Nocardia terrae]MVU78296.1 CoA transferase [Nocardia terrae]
MSTPSTSSGPLTGLRILDLTHVVMGPYATQLLADQGAEVIVLESPRGDTNRMMGAGPHPQLSGTSLNLMRNKRSVTLDLAAEDGQETVRRLVATCDVVVSSLRPRTVERLGLDYATLTAVRPDLVYCQAQGWPLDGPHADDPAYDDVIQAATGIADIMDRTYGSPALVPTILADKVCGVFIAQAITAALLHRERTGEGQFVEVPMTTAMSAFLLVEHGAGAIPEPPSDVPGYRRILSPERRPCPTVDGWVHLLPYQPDHYARLFAAVGRTDLLDDPRYADRRAAIANSDTLYRDVREVVAAYTTAEILEICAAQGIPATHVATLSELVDALPLGTHPVAGGYRVIPHPIRFSRTPADLRLPAPLIGADTETVLAELSGLGPEVLGEVGPSPLGM